MKIYGDIFLNNVKQSDKEIFDLNVEHSFTPTNLWQIVFIEGTTTKKKLGYNGFSFHKIQNAISGYICFKNLKFEISMIIYTDSSNLVKTITECHCSENPNYIFKEFDSSENNWWKLVDLDELRSLPEFENKTNIECFKELMEEHYNMKQDVIDYDSKFDFYKASDSSKLFNVSDFLYHIEDDSF